MLQSAFGQHCGLPFVQRIPLSPIIDSCQVPQPPEPIPACNGLQPVVEPAIPTVPCPNLSVATTVNVVPFGTAPDVSISTSRTVPQCGDDNCDLHLDFVFNLPQTPQSIQGFLIGPQGPRGFPGLDGLQGPPGYNGFDGAQGPQGPRGITGPEGPYGQQGAQGPQGPQGAKGAQGSTGPRGAKGTDGSDGYGFQGPQGPQGPAGTVQGAQLYAVPRMFTITCNPDGTFTVTPGDIVEVYGPLS